MKILLLLISLLLSLEGFSNTCETEAFSSNKGSVIEGDFVSKKNVELVNLINMYNPRFDLQLEKEELSREDFRTLIVPDNPALVFLKNFYSGNIHGENQFFFVKMRSRFKKRSSPLIGRVVKKINQGKALVEVVTVSGNLKKVEVEIEAAFHFDYYNEGTKDFFGDGFKVFVKSSDFNMRVQQGSSRLGMIFSALQSKRKRVSNSLLRIPERTSEEQIFANQGFNSAYTRGLNVVNEWISIVSQLIKLGVNPYKTHIDYFADKIEIYIEYIRKGLDSSDVVALRNLERLKKHAERTVQEKGVTYYWWLRFNHALSRISDFNRIDVDFMRQMSSSTKINIKTLVNYFPAYVVIPTVMGKMGIIAINRAHYYDIYMGDLTNDGGTGLNLKMSFDRNIDKIVRLTHVKNTHWDKEYREKYDLFIEKIQDLPPKKRRNVELALFMLMYKSGGTFFFAKPSLHVQSFLYSILSSQISNSSNFHLLNNTSSVSQQRIEAQIAEVVRDFMQVFREARGPMNLEF